MMLTTLLGTPVVVGGDELGQVVDLVADLAGGLDEVPVTGVLVDSRGGDRGALAWTGLQGRADGDGDDLVLVCRSTGPRALAPSEVLVRRDVLDVPVVLADRPRRARVSDVVLDVRPGGAWVVALDLSAAGAFRRLHGRSRPPAVDAPVRLSEVHLASPHGHAAQLGVPTALVHRLGPEGMAEVLTRVPVAHARDILNVGDRGVVAQALSLLHPHVRSRVTGDEPPPRQARRLAGWRLRPPGARGRNDR